MKLEAIAQVLLGGVFGVRAFDDKKALWARAGYAVVAADLLLSGFGTVGGSETPALAGGKLSDVSGGGALPKPLKFAHTRVRTIQERVARVHQQMIQGTRDPKIYELVSKVLAKKDGDGNWVVKEKDHWGEAQALFNEVRKRVRYTWDPVDYDAFQTPARTLELMTGDCFVKGTMVLRDDHRLVPIESLREGDRIWGHERWSTVTKTWEKGILPTCRIELNNGSSMRLTRDHKVWVYLCKRKHKGAKRFKCDCGLEARELVRITVGELQPGMVLTQPSKVDFGSEEFDPRRALIEGLYLSDGSTKETSFDIAGQDGQPKEAQKREVEALCRELGIPTRWARKQLNIKDKAWTERLKTMGTRAPMKHALSIGLNEAAARELLRGILADSGKNSSMGSTFTTTSHELWLQTRVLLKMAGLTASERYITDHGGLGINPIWRLGIRAPKSEGGRGKLLRVKEVLNDRLELPCFDIETDDHFVWLPEADWSTSQCDDYTSLLGAMLRRAGHQVRSRIVQTKDASTWNHIYLLVKVGNEWKPLDPSVSKPAGWEVPAGYVTAKQDFDVKEG